MADGDTDPAGVTKANIHLKVLAIAAETRKLLETIGGFQALEEARIMIVTFLDHVLLREADYIGDENIHNFSSLTIALGQLSGAVQMCGKLGAKLMRATRGSG